MSDEFQVVYPAPELIDDDGSWTIDADHGEGGATNASKRRIRVDLRASPHSTVKRTHELAHIKFSPAKVPSKEELAARGTDPLSVQAVEDLRVNMLTDRLGVDFTAGLGEDAVREAIGAVIQAAGGGAEDQAALAQRILLSLQAMPEDARTFKRLARRAMATPIAQIDAEVQAIVKEWETKDPTFEDTLDVASRLRPLSERTKQEIASQKLSILPAQMQPPESAGIAPWGSMKTEEPPRPISVRPLPLARTRMRHAEEGVHPHRLLRLPIDGRVFGERRKERGIGSLLIDGSGSMGWAQSEIVALLERAPAAVIAVYAGREVDGTLRILAKRGRMVAQEFMRSPGGGNIVDFPALQWLAEQPAPRFWMSDTYVTGLHDQHTKANQKQCLDLCKRKRIRVIAKLADLTA